MKLEIPKGSTAVLVEVFISDSSATDGSGLAGVTFGDITGYYYRSGSASPVELAALKTMTVGTWVTEGFKEISAANMPGYYQLGLPNAAIAPGTGKVNFMLKGATNMADLPFEIQLVEPYVIYAGGIWIDSGASNTNTVVGVDGIPSNPVSTLAAARTLADAIGVQKYYITNGSALTLAATHQWWEFVGIGRAANIINLGSQDVDNSRFHNLSLAGTQGGSTPVSLDECILTSLVSLRPWAFQCCIAGDITIQTGAMLSFAHCWSGVPGGSTPDLTFTAGVTSVQFRNYSGGQTFKNGTSDHTVSYDCPAGQLIIDASCNSMNINARGNIKITDNGTTTNLTDEAVYNQTNINEQVDNALNTAIPGSPTPDSINKVLQDQAEAASTHVTGAAVAGTLSTTEMTCDLTEATDDHYNGLTIKWTSGALKNQASSVTDYDGTSTPKKLVYVATTEAPSIGDTFVLG